MRERLVLCGGAEAPAAEADALRLNLSDPGQNITLRLHDISRPMVANIPDRLLDLLEVATYVYCADQATTRGGSAMLNLGELWRREFHFVVPVREPEVWSSPLIQSALTDTLYALSEDTCRFTFEPLRKPLQPAQPYFEEFGEDQSGFQPDQVIMFSGGLDSLAGAVDALTSGERRIALVSHQAATKVMPFQAELVRELSKRFGHKRLIHVPVLIHKDSELSREYTQRTRSFLFSSLGMVVGRLFGCSSVRLCENGIVSLNLPISPQLVGARASRTTHPQVLSKLSGLFSTLFDGPAHVENPFIWDTKGEVVRRLADSGCAEMIAGSVSCSRVHGMTKLHTHCGTCSQCLTRRFAVLASGQAQHDPADRYKVDLLTDAREPGESRTMAESFVRSAIDISELSADAFFQAYPQIARALRYLHMPSEDAARRILDLYRRHAREVRDVLVESVHRHAPELVCGSLPASCLIRLTIAPDHPNRKDETPADAQMTDHGSTQPADPAPRPPEASSVGAASSTVSSVRAETDCRRWLREEMRKGPPTKPKEAYWYEAQARFAVSRRGFERGWRTSVTDTGNTAWSTPGRRPGKGQVN